MLGGKQMLCVQRANRCYKGRTLGSLSKFLSRARYAHVNSRPIGVREEIFSKGGSFSWMLFGNLLAYRNVCLESAGQRDRREANVAQPDSFLDV